MLITSNYIDVPEFIHSLVEGHLDGSSLQVIRNTGHMQPLGITIIFKPRSQIKVICPITTFWPKADGLYDSGPTRL